MIIKHKFSYLHCNDSEKEILKGKYGAQLEFPDGWGDSNQKAYGGRGIDIFWNNTIQKCLRN